MKKALSLLLAAILALSLTACGGKPTESSATTTKTPDMQADATTNPDEKEKLTESTTIVKPSEDNEYSKWNSVFIAENGDSMTLNIYESGRVDYKYRYSTGGTESFFDENTEINGDTITMNGSDFDTEYGAEFTLNGDVLHCMAWNKMIDEAEKYVYIDIDMYRDGKLKNGSTVTIPAATTAATVIAEEIQHIYKTVRDDKPDDWDYFTAGEYMEVLYSTTGGIGFTMVFVNHNPNTYASYASSSEIGTYTTVQSYSGGNDGTMNSEYIGKAKIEFSGDYAYVTFEDGDTIDLIRVQ